MDFFIRKKARDWFFQNIWKEFSALPGAKNAPNFDAFYFCFIAGIVANRKTDLPAEETAQLVPEFPEAYKSRGALLVALFLKREIRGQGAMLTEQESVHDDISKLVDPGAANMLSDYGAREFNKYSFGGYEVLLEWFDDRPQTLETFLRRFKLKLDEALSNGKLE